MEDRSSRWIIEEEEPETPKPEWFEWAIGQTPSSNRVAVDGCDIHYLKWDAKQAEKAGILFVHGGAAHAQWWAFIAPFFADDRPVAAIDLSGMGDSAKRDEYSNAHRVAEMAAVIEDAGLGPKPLVVGHSFGGTMTMSFCGNHSADISGAVIVDSFVRPPSEDDGGSRGPGRPSLTSRTKQPSRGAIGCRLISPATTNSSSSTSRSTLWSRRNGAGLGSMTTAFAAAVPRTSRSQTISATWLAQRRCFTAKKACC